MFYGRNHVIVHVQLNKKNRRFEMKYGGKNTKYVTN